MLRAPLRLVFCLAVALCSTALVAAPSAQVFDSVSKPEQLDPDWRAHLCALLPQPCTADTLRLVRSRPSAEGAYVVLADEPLALATVQHAGAARWNVERLHDFSGYVHTLADAGTGDRVQLSLAPALYPLAEGRWAVAVLRTAIESYSGGGAAFSSADFVPLDTPTGEAAHAGIPFSCSKVVRACFSEKEYATSPHCHGESEGSLRIAYGAPDAGSGLYRWQYTWTESDWAAHRPRASTKTSRVRFTDGDADSPSFCGGPM